MLWSELIDRTTASFPDPTNLTTRAKKYLEEGQEDFAFHTKCYERERVIYIDIGDVRVKLPADFIELAAPAQIEFKGSILTHWDHGHRSRRLTDNSFETGYPKKFYLDGNNLVLYPSPSEGGLLSFRYVATPGNLTDSATAYKKLRYDNLTSGMFRVGDQIQGRTTSGTADIVFDENETNQGTLTLTNISFPSGTTDFQNDEELITIDAEQGMWLSFYSNSWSTLLTSWDTLGLDARAKAHGTLYDFAEAGDEPVILPAYHPFLVEYGRAMLHEERGELDVSDRYLGRYYQNRANVERQYSYRADMDDMIVQDVTDGQVMGAW